MIRKVRTPGYNYNFDTLTGYFERWGNTIDDDPIWSPVGPEIADIEISTVCSRGCPYCYKSNTKIGENMSLETFRKIFKHLPGNITQIAFGIGDIDGNPDMINIFKHCRKNSVIPNVTINGSRLTDVMIADMVSVCGAIAVSNHNDTETCYNAVKRLTDSGMKQVNIHQVLHKDSLKQCYDIIHDIKTDSRLSRLNAIVFLSLKSVGRGEKHVRVTDTEFSDLVQHALREKVSFGFDSCSCKKFEAATIDKPHLLKYAEPCESSLFSIYINVVGDVYPCSFSELPAFKCGSAVKENVMDIWNGYTCNKFREMLHGSCRKCPVHKV